MLNQDDIPAIQAFAELGGTIEVTASVDGAAASSDVRRAERHIRRIERRQRRLVKSIKRAVRDGVYVDAMTYTQPYPPLDEVAALAPVARGPYEGTD